MSAFEGISRSTRYGIFLTVGFLIYPTARNVLHPIYQDKTPRKNRTAIVTGATGNLGLAITRQLAKRQARVIMACRDMEKCKLQRRELILLTGNKGIVCRHLDLENIDSINKFAKQMIETEPHIDILINNAAVKHVEEKEITKYGVEKNYFVNFMAPFLLTFLLMDKLKEASLSTKDSRIINMIGNPKKDWNVDLDDINFDKRKYDPKVAYKQSKMALAYFTILLDKLQRTEKSCIYVFGSGPGTNNITKTFEDHFRPLERLKWYVDTWYKYSPERLICPVVKCALDPNFASPKQSGGLYCYFLNSFGWGSAGKDETKAKVVWNAALKTLLAPK